MKRSLAALLYVFFVACSGNEVVIPQDNRVLQGVVTLNGEWVQDKGKKYDLRFAIANEHKKAIIIKLGEIACYRGETRGDLKHTFFNTGERTMDFGVGERKVFNLVCNYGVKTTGAYKIKIAQIHDNPKGDGKTPGKVIARNLEWTFSDQVKKR